jgi:hypothetical protein
MVLAVVVIVCVCVCVCVHCVASIYFCVTGEHIAPSNSWDSPALYDTFDAIEAFELPPRRTLSLAVPTSHASSTPTAPANAHADDDRSAAGRVRRPVRRFDASPGVVDGDATSPAAAAPAAGSTRARRSRHEPRTPVLFGEHIALDNCLRACLAPSAALRPVECDCDVCAHCACVIGVCRRRRRYCRDCAKSIVVRRALMMT